MLSRVVRTTTAVVFVLVASCGEDPTDPGSDAPGPITPLLQPGVSEPWRGIAAAGAHEYGHDLRLSRNGRAAYVRSTRSAIDSGAFGAILQEISAIGHRGKRVRLSGYVRTDSVAGTGAGLWMRIDSPTRTVAFDNMIAFGRALRGNSDWVQHAVVLDVPDDAVGITFGILLSGSGIVRVDDLSFETVDASVSTTGDATAIPISRDSAAAVEYYERLAHAPENLDFEATVDPFNLTVAWLKSAARPFTTEVAGAGLNDLAELGTILNGARIAAFGEATHGSREFFRMKHRAFEFLVETQGYTHFLIEATMPEARVIDRFVTHGEGDPTRALANLYFWTWNTQEVLDLIYWMRTYNIRAGTPRLRFFGFDMQFPHQALDSLPVMLARVEARLQVQASEAVACFEPVRLPSRHLSGQQYAALPSTHHDRCANALAQLADTARTHRANVAAALGASDADWLEQYISLARQWAHMARTSEPLEIFNRRDRAMADNALWIASREPQARHFVWAHNGHVSRRPNTMGRHLAHALGSQYRNVAFTFGNGRFNAVSVLPSGAFGPLQVHTTNGPAGGTLESLFNATLEPRLILDTRKVLSGEAGSFALSRRPLFMRSIGSVYSAATANAYYERAILPFDYDGIIWFVNTRESQLLSFSQVSVRAGQPTLSAPARRKTG